MSKQITPHFSFEELRCKCGKCKPSSIILTNLNRLAAVLEEIRLHFGRPVIVTCAHRCPSHNAAVGGVSDSQHLTGLAADIAIDEIQPDEIATFAATLSEVGGLGVYPGMHFCHVDIRRHAKGQIARWQG